MQNFIDYEVLGDAASRYKMESDNLMQMVQTLLSQNEMLQSGWQNKTAEAFIERFNTEYKPNLESAAEALDSIANFINTYVSQQQEQDQGIASGIRG